ncbi:hypothetical protein [Winogradskyella schleiferi]|uniref:hypothetical protein n=1 Tax=Winogradskyella schleiferi TaxID=2686078 RepID=UPI0015B95A78|nr:hypothetical protein [Winogradskyella schleiferi]
MKLATIIITTFILAFTSCKGEYISNSAEDLAELYETDATSNRNHDYELTEPTLKYYPILDDKQEVVGAYPFPADWILNTAADSIYIQSPLGAKVFKNYSNYFWDYRSSELNNKYKTQINTAAYKTIETLLKEDFRPYADSLNIKLTHQFEIPEVAKLYKDISSLYYSINKPKEDTFKALATEWLDEKGIKSVVVIVHHSQIFENETLWGYTLHTLEAPEAYFELTKKTFLYSLKNYKTCYNNIYEANKLNTNIPYNNTCRYYTIKERQEQREAINKEKLRTGMFSKNLDEYLEFLRSKGFLTIKDSNDVCNLTTYYKNEEDRKHHLDSIYTNYVPIDNSYKN